MGPWPANSIRDRGSVLPQKSGYTRAILTFLASRIEGLANRGVHIHSYLIFHRVRPPNRKAGQTLAANVPWDGEAYVPREANGSLVRICRQASSWRRSLRASVCGETNWSHGHLEGLVRAFAWPETILTMAFASRTSDHEASAASKKGELGQAYFESEQRCICNACFRCNATRIENSMCGSIEPQ